MPLRVLVVEDSPDDAELILHELDRCGYEPRYERVETPEAMREALDAEEWDVVISDHDMPRFSAPAALEILQREGDWDVPFIIVSGRIGEDAAVAVMRAGACDYVVKGELGRLGPTVERETQKADGRRKRRRGEAALARREELYRAVVEQCSECIFLVDASSKRLIETNDALRRLLGYGPKEIEGLSLYDLVPHDDRASVDEDLRLVVAQGRLDVERRYRRKDGDLVEVRVRSNKLLLDAREIICNVARDLTGRKEAEEALSESEERYRTLFESMTQGVVYQDAEGEIYSANPAAQRVLGLSLDQMQGRTSLDPRWQAIREDSSDFPGEEHPIPVALRTGRRVENVVMGVYVPEEEEYRWLRINATPQFRPGEDEPYQAYAIFEDITERKRAEERLEEIKESERRRIAADLHDEVLQDLVHGLQETQVAQLLLTRSADENVSPDLAGSLETVSETLQLSVEGLRAAIFELRLRETLERSFVSSVEALVELNRRRSRKRAKVHLTVEEGFPEATPTEASRSLVRILQEALSNARRHSEARNIRVVLRTEGEDVYAEVADDGRGFDVEGARGGIGTGAMRQRALDLGGALEIRSEPDSGTTVRFRGSADLLLGG